MKHSKHTIFYKVVFINTIIALLFTCIYLFNFFYFDFKSKQELEQYSNQFLNELRKNFETEMNRLDTLMKMCSQNSSFVLALSNILPANQFSNYARTTSEKLSMIQYSLPYAENVFVYSNNGKFIFTNSVLSKDELLSMSNKKFLSEIVDIDFSSLHSGFYSLNGKSICVSNILKHGSLIIQIDTQKFCNLHEISSALPDYEIAILDGNNHAFAISSGKMQDILAKNDLIKAETQSLTYDGEKYLVMQRTAGNGFRLVLLGRSSALQISQQKNNLINIFVSVVFLIICIVMVLMNTRIYRPLQRIARNIDKGRKINEIDLISGKLTELADENMKMNERINKHYILQADIELNYAIQTRQGISEDLSEQLLSRYGKYRMMALALQKQSGDGEELFVNIDNYFTDTFECKIINIDPFAHAYMIPEFHEIEEILVILEGYFSGMKPDTMVFIGISDSSGDFTRIHSMYSQAYERMMSNKITLQKRYMVCFSDYVSNQSCASSVSMEVQNTIAKYVANGTYKDLEDILQHIFFSDNSITLKTAINIYKQLSSLLLVLLTPSSNILEPSDLITTAKRPVYHLAHMYHTLLEDFKKLNDCSSKGHSALRYEIVDYLHQHYKEPLSLDSISAVFGITPVYLSSWFKKNTGVNLSIYLSNIRMEQAKRILGENKHIKISSLAVEVGIPGVAAFIRQFKNYTGSTPDQYRQCR